MTNEITIPTGYEFSHVEGDKIKLKAIIPRVRKWEEQGGVEGVYVNGLSQIVKYPRMDRLNTNLNTFHTEKQALASIALAKLTQSLADLNQEPIVWDGVTVNYCIIFCWNGSFEIKQHSNQAQLLAFHDEKIATEFLTVHRDDILAAAPLLWGVEIGGDNE